METGVPASQGKPQIRALKPSLVEWKPVLEVRDGVDVGALKPSLVEWKQDVWKPVVSGAAP